MKEYALGYVYTPIFIVISLGIIITTPIGYKLSEQIHMVYYASQDEVNNDHGRIEERHCTVLPRMYLFKLKLKWKALRSLVKIDCYREIDGIKHSETRYYISSLSPDEAQRIMCSVRSHWQIENNLHWVLDVAFREDNSRTRDEVTAINMAWIRKVVLGFIKKETSFKASIRRKQLKAWAKRQR